MTKTLGLIHTTLIVFVVSFIVSIWNYFLVTLSFLHAVFDLPTDAWERAKEIEKRLAKEGTD